MNNNTLFANDLTTVSVSYPKHRFSNANVKSSLYILPLIAYLRFNASITGKLTTCLNEVAASCGKSSPRRDKVWNEIFRDRLLYLQNKHYINCDKDLKSVKNNELFKLQILDDSFIVCPDNFVMLNQAEFETIINADTSISKELILAAYLCIKKDIYNREPIYPKLAVISHSFIASVIGVSSTSTVKSILNVLKGLNLIFWEANTYLHKDSNHNLYCRTKNAYSLDEENLKYSRQNLEEVYRKKIYTRDELPKGTNIEEEL